jgi:tyrosine-protein phosphatase YwqE
MLGSLLKKKYQNPLRVDIHSHLIPGIDDGSPSLEESIQLILGFKELGFEKLITTPHTHPNYPNTQEKIISGHYEVVNELEQRGISIEFETATEYYVDELFYDQVKDQRELLTFSDKMILVESSFLFKPFFFEEVLFELISQGFKPVLAHPERYQFVDSSMGWFKELKKMGVAFQVTLGSLTGYYGANPKKIGKALLAKNMVDLLGSDLHHSGQLKAMQKALVSKEVSRYSSSGRLLNNIL